jgi:rsbT co-antagonist protein RsbR
VARSRLVDNLEQLVAERTARVQENERFLHQIIDTIPDLIYVKDAEGRYVLANQALADVFGTTTEAVVGKSDGDLGLSEELNQEYLAINRKVRETKQPLTLPEHTVADPETQEERFYQSTILPIISGDGEAHQIVGVSVNITDRKQMEQERERMQQEIIEAQRQALQELSTPVIPVMDRILVMPLVGNIDTMRARDIMRALLEGISDHRAKVVILDVTGVPIMDTGIVNHIHKTIQAARLKGAQTIVTGISDAVAEAIVDLGIDWGAVETLSDLRTGLVVALDRLGVRLTTDK